MVGVGGLSLPSKLLSAGRGREKDTHTCGPNANAAESSLPSPEPALSLRRTDHGGGGERKGWGGALQEWMKWSGMENGSPQHSVSGRHFSVPVAALFTSHLSYKANTGVSEHHFASAQGSRACKSHWLQQTQPLPPSQACHSFSSSIMAALLCPSTAQQPISLPTASQWIRTSTLLPSSGLSLLPALFRWIRAG